MAAFFSVITSDQVDFDPSHLTAASMVPGTIVKLDTNGAWAVCTSASADRAYGFALRNNQFSMFPTDNNIAAASYVTVARGAGRAVISTDGTVGTPTVGDPLYSSATGVLTTTDAGSQFRVAIYEGSETVQYGAGPETTERWIISFNFPNH